MPPPWRIAWSHAARAQLRAIPLADGEAVDRAVQHFAATGQARSARRHGPAIYYLFERAYVVRLNVNDPDGALLVVYVHHRR